MKTLVVLVLVLGAVLFSRAQFQLGICRTHLVNGVFDNEVTIDDLVNDGDYTILYTNGLRQFKDVKCARLGYQYTNSTTVLYTNVETGSNMLNNTYAVNGLIPGKLIVSVPPYKSTLHYIVYRKNNVLLIYWCNDYARGDEHWYNNIWIIAAKTDVASDEDTKKAILEMLYHDDFRHLINKGTEDVRAVETKYLKLAPCQGSMYYM